MCNKACIDFGKVNLSKEDINGKSVIDVGSVDINGTMRDIVAPLGPSKFVGVDLHMGKGVDQVCRVEDLITTFGIDSFDVVITTEMLEHVPDWRVAIHNLKGVLKRGGKILITTRSFGFGYHEEPYDCWRYEISDMKVIFSDFDIQSVQGDPFNPGVFISAKKPIDYVENDLKDCKLYSMLKNERI